MIFDVIRVYIPASSYAFLSLRTYTRYQCISHFLRMIQDFLTKLNGKWRHNQRPFVLRPTEVYIIGHILVLETSLPRPTFICLEQTHNLRRFFLIWKVFFSIWNYLRRAVKNRETKLNESSSSGKKNGNVWINEGWCLQLTNLAGRNWSRTRVMTAAACLTARLPDGLPAWLAKVVAQSAPVRPHDK